MRNTKKLRQFGIFLLIILLSTYLPQTIGLYVTIILGLGADVYSLILTMVLERKKCLISIKHFFFFIVLLLQTG